MNYQFFGSADSLDTDVVFFVESLPATIFDRAQLCKELSDTLYQILKTGNGVNGNLAVAQDGYVKSVHKGTADELNNALYHTYDLHQQHFQNRITRLLPRDVDLKFIRSTRMILSALSRTRYRTEIKKALNSDLYQRIETLARINLEEVTSSEKGYNLVDLKKLLAFQMGQTLALHHGLELYTKDSISERYPQLKACLYRAAEADWKDLNNVRLVLISVLSERAKTMEQTNEYEYRHRM